jgi:hypothetical protein
MVIELSEERSAEPDISCGLRTHLSTQKRPRLGWVAGKFWSRVKKVEVPPAP